MIKDKMQRSTKNRAQVRQQFMDEIREWYVMARGVVDIDKRVEAVECDDEDPLTGEKRWWIEPCIPGVANPRLVERPLGNSDWSLSIESMDPPIRSFGGL